MQYVVDARVDEASESALLKILSLAPLPADPYNILSGELRRAALRFELAAESPKQLISRLLKSDTRQVSSSSPGGLWCGPQGLVAGFSSAMQGVDVATLKTIFERLAFLRCPPLQAQRGYYGQSVLSLTGSILEYKRTVQHVGLIEMQEHFQMQGPQRGEAMDTFTAHLTQHLQQLNRHGLSTIKSPLCIVSGVNLGAAQWSASELQTGAHEFAVS